MGGNVFKGQTRRHEKTEYIEKSYYVIDKLNELYDLNAIKLIASVHDKETFGDADILYSYGTYAKEFDLEDIKRIFKTEYVSKNGDVISFALDGLQVDLIKVDLECMQYAYCYFSYNDLGNFIGKLARNIGLSHGHDGLWLPVRDLDGNLFQKISVTRNHDETLRLLGLDVLTFGGGFETIEDVFRFVQSSPYFTPESYKLENVSSIGRVRDRKRDSYKKFLAFNESYRGLPFQRVEDKSQFLPMILSHFPYLKHKLETVMSKYHYSLLVKSKFNGDIVKELTGLNGKELGEFMKKLRTLPEFSSGAIGYLSVEIIRENIHSEFNYMQNMKRWESL